jgi:hypothetical protein
MHKPDLQILQLLKCSIGGLFKDIALLQSVSQVQRDPYFAFLFHKNLKW